MDETRATWPPWRILALAAGPLLGLSPTVVPPPGALPLEAWRLVGLAAWMVCWWLTEAVPLPATALLPIPLMPLLGVAPEKQVVSGYAHPLIFLFLGGFILAAAIERSGLHRRIALQVVARVGGGPAGIVGGFMAATAFLSMWISNTATALLMFTIGLALLEYLEGVVEKPESVRPFGLSLMLGIAYSASIGGTGTLIGTPPNALLASFVEKSYGFRITMTEWLAVGLPYVAVMLPLAWLWLTRWAFPLRGLRLGEAGEHVRRELAELGRASREERFVLGVFLATAAAWILRGPLARVTGLPWTDTTVALVAALVLLAVPLSLRERRFALDWEAVESLPWGVLILFGGGLALAGAFQSTGLAEAIAGSLRSFSGVDPRWTVLAATIVVVMLTELTSNTATAATFLPIMGAVAVGLGESPMLLAVPVAMAASAAFMMPVATPPNAIVFAYEEMRIGHMMRAGLMLNLFSIVTITAIVLLLAWRVLPGF